MCCCESSSGGKLILPFSLEPLVLNSSLLSQCVCFQLFDKFLLSFGHNNSDINRWTEMCFIQSYPVV